MSSPIRSNVTTPVWAFTLSLLVFHAYMGAGYLLNPPYAQRPDVYTYVLNAAPLNTWGIAFLLGIPFVLLSAIWQNKVAAMSTLIAAGPMIVFTILVFAAEFDGTSSRFGSAALFTLPLVLHGVMARHSWKRGCT